MYLSGAGGVRGSHPGEEIPEFLLETEMEDIPGGLERNDEDSLYEDERSGNDFILIDHRKPFLSGHELQSFTQKVYAEACFPWAPMD